MRVTVILCFSFLTSLYANAAQHQLRFRGNGEFKILQIADMHYANGKSTRCLDVTRSQMSGCSDLNTTAFVRRLILAESPDLIVFTGDNIFGADVKDPATSLMEAFLPAIESNIPWAAVLGNHDQESTLSREEVMKHVVRLTNTLSKVNPEGFRFIDGFGNYDLQVSGLHDSPFENKSVLNLYFLDSGDYSTVPSILGYGWIQPSQQLWFLRTSLRLKREYAHTSGGSASGLVFFHIPLPEFSSFDSSNFTGVKQEQISSPKVNSGFFSTMLDAGDVKAAFVGHDHVNDFCGKMDGIHLCYAGGVGYHAYGKVGWSRRARVVLTSLEKKNNGEWGAVNSIKTWKRLDDKLLTTIDTQILWTSRSVGSRRINHLD